MAFSGENGFAKSFFFPAFFRGLLLKTGLTFLKQWSRDIKLKDIKLSVYFKTRFRLGQASRSSKDLSELICAYN